MKNKNIKNLKNHFTNRKSSKMEWGWKRFYSKMMFGVENGVELGRVTYLKMLQRSELHFKVTNYKIKLIILMK